VIKQHLNSSCEYHGFWTDVFSPTANMKLILTTSVLLALGAPSVSAFAPVLKPILATHCTQCRSGLSMSTETTEDVEAPQNKKDRRRKIMQSPSFYRRGFKEQREGVEETMAQEYESDLVKELKSKDFVVERSNVRVHLAKDFGFCWGVERSIALAYEAVNHFPDRTVHITNELIHNPEVNDKLANMNVQFIEKLEGGGKRFDTVQDNDVVILPAFGASLEEMDMFDQKVRF
jgi:4-hydroxy-3-methylbut-2-enyl diphosphate reductase